MEDENGLPGWERLLPANSDVTGKPFFTPRVGHSVTAIGPNGGTLIVVGGRHDKTFAGDVLKLELSTGRWSRVCAVPFKPRAYHAALSAAGGDELWVIGGSDTDVVLSDVWVLDTRSWQWRKVNLKGRPELTARTACASAPHPTVPGAFLLHGGYGSSQAFLGDLVLVDTVSGYYHGVGIGGMHGGRSPLLVSSSPPPLPSIGFEPRPLLTSPPAPMPAPHPACWDAPRVFLNITHSLSSQLLLLCSRAVFRALPSLPSPAKKQT